MAVRPPEIEIGIFHIPSFFRGNSPFFRHEGKRLRHDKSKVNVFAWKKNRFVDAYPMNIKVQSLTEFQTVKERLLNLPTYLEVQLEHKNCTKVVGVYVNPTSNTIKQQLSEYLGKVEAILLLDESSKFALDIDFTPILKDWFITKFGVLSGTFHFKGSCICITNFTSRSRECSNPALWCLCFPLCLFVCPLYYGYRKALSNDFSCVMSANIQQLSRINVNRTSRQTMHVSNINETVRQENATDLPSYEEPPPSYSEVMMWMQDDSTC